MYSERKVRVPGARKARRLVRRKAGEMHHRKAARVAVVAVEGSAVAGPHLLQRPARRT